VTLLIRLIFGNAGSGKTASVVRYIKNNPHKMFITNIDLKGRAFKHVLKLKADMIIKREQISSKRDGQPVYKLKLNVDFWKNLILEHKQMNVVIDEAHIFFNPRRSMSKINIIMTDFLALIRRILGASNDNGELILISQLSRRLDVIAKEMSTDVSFCINHYKMFCPKCHATWNETNETPNKFLVCPRCKDYRIKKIKTIIEIFDFKDVDSFVNFKEFNVKTYYRRYLIKDIESVFGDYDTLQFDDMFSEY
jgi:hypothetical protein